MAFLIEYELLNKVFQGLNAVRSELCLFFLAFALHRFMLGNYFPRGGASASARKQKQMSATYGKGTGNNDQKQIDNVPNDDPEKVLQVSQAAHERGDHRTVLRCWSSVLRSSNVVPASHLAHVVEAMQRFKKDSSLIVAEVRIYLKRNISKGGMTYINRLLEPLAKSLDTDVVQGIVALLSELGVEADSHTFEVLIHMRFTTRSFEEVQALAQEMESKAIAPTPRTNVMLLKSALQTGQLDDALNSFRRIAVAGRNSGEPPTVSEAPQHIAAQLVEVACRSGRLEAVLPDLESGVVPVTTDLLNLMLTECSRTRNKSLSERVEKLGRHLGIGRDGRTYQALVKGAGLNQARIMELLDEMADNSVSLVPDVVTAVLAACAQSRDTTLADRLYTQLGSDPEQPGQVVTLQALVRFFAEAGKPEKACDIFEKHLKDQMSGADDTKRRTVLDAKTERCILSAALQCGRSNLSAAVLEVAPTDTAKHISIIRGCAAKGNLQEAMGIFRSLQASGAEMKQSLYNTMLDACVECRDWKQAESLMKQIEDAGIADVVTFNTLIKAYLRTENFDRARGLMSKMRRCGCAPNHVTYNELINAFIRHDNYSRTSQAWEVVDEMKKDGVQPNRITCSILLKNLKAKSSQSDITRTMELVSSMEEPMDEVLMSSVVEACVRIGKPSLLSQKLAQLHRNSGITITGAQTFGSLIKAYGHAREIDGAWRCWKEMRSRHVKPTSITIGCMVEAVASSGDVDGAYELITQLLEDDECKEQVNAVIFGSVLKGYGRMKSMERVWSVFREMLSKGIEPSVVTFNAIIDACARSGRMDNVPKLQEDMRKRGLAPNLITFSTMIKGFCQHGDMPAALGTLHELRKHGDLRPDGIVYNTLLDGCSQAGLAVEGERLFNEMLEEGVVPTNYTLTVMVRMMGQTRRADRAQELVESLPRKYRFRANSHVLNALIQACLSSRDLRRAISAFDQMSSEGLQLDARTRQGLVRGLLSGGNALKAAQVLRTALGLGGRPAISSERSNESGGASTAWAATDDALLGDVLTALLENPAQDNSEEVAIKLHSEVRAGWPTMRFCPIVERKVVAAQRSLGMSPAM